MNGTWTLFSQNFSTAATGSTTLNRFSLDFSTGMTLPVAPAVAASQFGYVYKTNTVGFSPT